MSTDETQALEREQRLDEVIAAYLQAVQAGQASDQREWLACHPDLAPELAEFLADRERLERLAGPVRAAVSACPAVGSRVGYAGDYQLLAELGRGGMGVVYKARQTSLKRLVALKMILAGAHASEQAAARFRVEAEAVAQLQHPNIVQIHEIGKHEGHAYFSLEFVEGGSLDKKLAATPMPSRQGAQLVEVLAWAVQAAHEKGIVHRDLKPANVLLATDGTPKITDFGLAKLIREDAGQTGSGLVLGTPSYMAPEQASGKSRQVGPAADVYSLGAILYELLTGRPPFRAETPLDTIMQVVNGDPVPPSRLQPKVPRDLETICLHCLQKDPRRRYASAAALAEDLRRFLDGRPIMARPVGALERGWRWCRRNPALAGAAGVAVAALVAAAALVVVLALHESRAADRLRREKGQTEAALQESRRLSADLALDRGLRLCEDDVARGMLWLARSLELAPPDAADLQRAARMNLAAWRLQLHTLRAYTEFGQADYLAFSADGRVALTAGRNESTRKVEVQLWEAATGKPLGPPWEHKDSLASLALSPDGKGVLTGSKGTARLWEAATGKPLGPPLKHGKHSITCLALSSDGKALLTEGFVADFRLWEAVTGKPIGKPLRHRDEVRAAAFSPDGRLFLTLSDWQNVLWWDAATGKPLGGSPWPEAKVSAAVFSPNSTTVLTGGPESAHLRTLPAGAFVGRPFQYTGRPKALALSRDGARVLTASRPGGLAQFEVRLWKADPREPLGRPLRQEGHVEAVAFAPDGRTFLTAKAALSERQWAVRLWEPARGLSQGETSGPLAPFGARASPLAVAFSPDGKVFVTPFFEDAVRIWNAVTAQPIGPPLVHTGHVSRVAFSADSRTILTWSEDKTVWQWEAATGKLRGRRTLAREDDPWTTTFSPDGRTLLTRGLKTAWLWDFTGKRSGQPLRPVGEVRHWFQETAEAFSPDGKKILTAGPNGSARLWDAATGKPQGVPLGHGSPIRAVAFSPDGKKVLTAGGEESGQKGSARLWDVATGQPLGAPLPHQGAVTAVAFSPDGKTLLTGSRDGTARLWHVATGKPIHLPLAHRDPVTVVAFSPDGNTALTTSKGTAHLWDVASGKLIGPSLSSRASEPGGPITGVFRPDGRAVVTATVDKARLWVVPSPVAGDADRIVLWVQVLTGMELDAAGVIRELDASTWQQRRQRLRRLGGPPLP
jgi:eukaryotic-like serine/threonine-protein kinase